MGLLRDYLELEFGNAALPFPFELERLIDDFVLFCMLIGNDFLPCASSCWWTSSITPLLCSALSACLATSVLLHQMSFRCADNLQLCVTIVCDQDVPHRQYE